MAFNKLKIGQKIMETEDSCSVLLDIPTEVKEQYDFKPGQYLTVKLEINGQEVRRAYSIFTAPHSNQFGFTVKRVKGGLVSNYLIDKVNVGDEMEVMTPDGKFVVDANHQTNRDYYFFAGGSGITPIMSMVSTILEKEPMSSCFLLYGSRNENSIIFKNQLDEMARKHEGQLHVSHIISQPNVEKKGGLKGLFGKKSNPTWRGMKGRINTDILTRYMEDHPSRTGRNVYYLCGPNGMIETVENYLINLGTESVQIKKEYFTAADSASTGAATTSSKSEGTNAKVILNGETFIIHIPSNKTILDALIDESKDPPYSCTSGACSTCMAKVIEGEVAMDVCFALDDDEVKDGYILTCQSRCQTSNLVLDFES